MDPFLHHDNENDNAYNDDTIVYVASVGLLHCSLESRRKDHWTKDHWSKDHWSKGRQAVFLLDKSCINHVEPERRLVCLAATAVRVQSPFVRAMGGRRLRRAAYC